MLLALLFPAFAAPPALTEEWSCKTVGSMPGTEDFVVLGEHILVSSDARRRPEVGGGIYAVDPVGGALHPDKGGDWTQELPLLGRDACTFHPHGMDLEGEDLWVVVHFQPDEGDGCVLMPHVRDAVEHFRVTDSGLEFVERLQTPEFTEPNDVDATSDGRLFVSNNPEFGMMEMIRGAFLWHRPSVVLSWDRAAGWEVAAKRLFYSNGVWLAPDGLLTVATYGGKLYTLREEKGKWRRQKRTKVHGTMDNLMLGEDGRLWVAAHPKAGAFIRHVKHPTKIAPSEAYAFVRDGDKWKKEDAWMDKSGTVEASSTVTLSGGNLVFGQVFSQGVVVCSRR